MHPHHHIQTATADATGTNRQRVHRWVMTSWSLQGKTGVSLRPTQQPLCCVAAGELPEKVR